MAQGQGVVRVARTDELEIVVGVPEHRLKTVREPAPRASTRGPIPASAMPSPARAVAQRRSHDPDLSGAFHSPMPPPSSASA